MGRRALEPVSERMVTNHYQQSLYYVGHEDDLWYYPAQNNLWWLSYRANAWINMIRLS